MKGRYITTKILLACLSQPGFVTKDIHKLLQETIAEHKKIMQRFNDSLTENEDEFIQNKKAA